MEPREFNPGKTLLSTVLLVAAFFYMYSRKPHVYEHAHVRGDTMGTTYEIKIAKAGTTDQINRRLFQGVETILKDVNQQMSTYIPDSEISQFNVYQSTEPFPVSRKFAQVTAASINAAKITDGAFDPTLGPLINLWGFGHQQTERVPTEQELLEVAHHYSYLRLDLPEDGQLQKSIPELELNLSAIAKGYGVDEVFDYLSTQGYTNLYVEIGGEVRTMGQNTNGVPWRIGIQQPERGAAIKAFTAVNLSGKAMATSGNYRNFRKGPDGKTYAHIIDPRTSYPVTHSLASVSVIAPTCMEADALATALYVMGAEEGLGWVNAHADVEALFIVRKEDDRFEALSSSGFDAYLK